MQAMLDSSQHLYFVNNNRKISLTHFIVDHGAWVNIKAWKECIEHNIKKRIAESLERSKLRTHLKHNGK